jgi:tRNA(Ile2) C34 agmatinyltransferase TiaS
VIYVGIDDTDIAGTPGTNQLARAILKRLGLRAEGAIICRHQLFFDPRVPYTSKNGSASIQLPLGERIGPDRLTDAIRDVMREWFVEGSDPGLCVASGSCSEMERFAARAKIEVVTQAEARAVASSAGCHLEALGGTGQGIIGALSAVPLAAGGNDGRVVHLAAWPYPDDFSGRQDVTAVAARGVEEIRELGSDRPHHGTMVDVGKHLRPNWRGGRVVLYVEPPTEEPGCTSDSASAGFQSPHPRDSVSAGFPPWRAVKLL